VTAPRLERLSAAHDLSEFRCGSDALDTWLAKHALPSQRMNSARTFVLTDGSLVLGYFSLTMGSVLRSEPPADLVRALPAYPVGVALLARLAVRADHHGQGIGGLLLAAALRKAVAAGEAVAARLVVVDAIDEGAASFYAQHGFIPVPEHPLRLYRRLKDIRASLGPSGG
jgi:predicted N-acetyltransferase YhbS